MNSVEDLFQVRRTRLTQDDIWTHANGSPLLTILGETEELLVLGLAIRLDGAELFEPRRYDGKIADVYRNEGYAHQVCRSCNAATWNEIWQRVAHDDHRKRLLLAEVALNYFQPGLAHARWQAEAEGYDRALADLVLAARREGTWHTGLAVSCVTDGNFVLINEPGTPFASPPLMRITIADLAGLAFPPEQDATLHFEQRDLIFEESPFVIPVAAMSAAGGIGLAYLEEPFMTSRTKYIVGRETGGGRIRRLLSPSWGMTTQEQARALIARIAPLVDWTKPEETLFEGLSREEIGARVRQSCRDVGGNDGWAAGGKGGTSRNIGNAP